MMLDELILEQLKRDGYWFDIGQLRRQPETLKALTRLTRKGLVIKSRAIWPWITHGTIKKTMYQPT